MSRLSCNLATSVATAALLASPSALGQSQWDPGERESRSVQPVVSGDVPRRADGAYGRFAGDLDVGLLLGAELGTETRRPGARLSLHYFSMAGVAIGYADALGSETPSERTLTVGVDLRPLFVPRWSNDLARGPAVVDLTVDSLSIGAGVFWDQPTEHGFGDRRGFEGSLGLGVPLFGRARGLWVEGRATARWAATADDSSPRATGVGLVLVGWHQLVRTPLVGRR